MGGELLYIISLSFIISAAARQKKQRILLVILYGCMTTSMAVNRSSRHNKLDVIRESRIFHCGLGLHIVVMLLCCVLYRG